MISVNQNGIIEIKSTRFAKLLKNSILLGAEMALKEKQNELNINLGNRLLLDHDFLSAKHIKIFPPFFTPKSTPPKLDKYLRQS